MLWLFIIIIAILLIILFVTSKPDEDQSEEIPVYVCSECNETDCKCHLDNNKNSYGSEGDQ